MSALIVIPAVAALADLAAGWMRPYKACPRCAGRGHCTRCGYTGRVLTWAGWVMHPELRRK